MRSRRFASARGTTRPTSWQRSRMRRRLGSGGSAGRFRDHFRRINRILRDPDRIFPDPRERLLFEELDQLTREFIETSLVATGVEWFRQRVAAGPEAGVFKNWDCAALLNEEAGDLAASWRCRLHSWRVTQHRRNVDPRKKAQLLRTLLGWAQRHGFREDGLRVLRQTWPRPASPKPMRACGPSDSAAPAGDVASGPGRSPQSAQRPDERSRSDAAMPRRDAPTAARPGSEIPPRAAPPSR